MNDVQWVVAILLIVCSVLGVLMGLKVKTEASYYVMERKAPTLILVASLSMSYISGVTMCSGPGLSYQQGPFAILTTSQFGAWLGTIVAVLFVGRKLKAIGCYTLGDYFKRRFCSPHVTFLATAIMCVGLLLYGIGQLMIIGSMLSDVIGVSYGFLIFILTLVIILFSVPSGTWGIMLTDLVMFLVLVVAVFIGCPYILNQLGPEAVQTLPPEFWQLNGLFQLSGLQQVSQFVIWFMFFACSPLIVSRVFPAKNDFSVLKACVISIAIISLVSSLSYLVGGVMAGTDPALYPSEKVIIYAFTQYTPGILRALGIAGILSAAITTAALLFNLAGFGLSKDIYELMHKDKTTNERSALLRGRACQLIVISLAGLIVYLKPSNIYNLSSFVSGLFAATWLPVIVFSLLWKRMNGKAALYGMLVGSISLLVFEGLFYLKDMDWGLMGMQYLLSIAFAIVTILIFGYRYDPSAEEVECHYKLKHAKLSHSMIHFMRTSDKKTWNIMKEYKRTWICLVTTVGCSILIWILFFLWVHRILGLGG